MHKLFHVKFSYLKIFSLHVLLLISYSEVNHFSTHSVNVGAPNVSMKVADRLGRDLFTAQVGDPLLLLFQITDHNSKNLMESKYLDGKFSFCYFISDFFFTIF